MNASLAVYIKLIATLNSLVKKKQLDRTASIDIPANLIAQLTGWGLEKSDIKLLRQYIENNSRPTSPRTISVNVETDKLRQSIQLFYEALCKTIGPVETDLLFSEAIKQVETIRAAKIFSPRDLL